MRNLYTREIATGDYFHGIAESIYFRLFFFENPQKYLAPFSYLTPQNKSLLER